MSCRHALARSRRGALVVLGTLVVSASCTTGGTWLHRSRPYRVPVIVLAYPERGTALPADKAVVLIRFAPREADDPIDVASFKATVDGVDRTGQFRVTSSEAWGTLVDSIARAGASPASRITTGPHTITARVCSVRGACGALTVVVEVRPWERAISAEQVTWADRRTPHHSITVSRAATAPGSSLRADAGV